MKKSNIEWVFVSVENGFFMVSISFTHSKAQEHLFPSRGATRAMRNLFKLHGITTVSYTHLTLPTILLG